MTCPYTRKHPLHSSNVCYHHTFCQEILSSFQGYLCTLPFLSAFPHPLTKSSILHSSSLAISAPSGILGTFEPRSICDIIDFVIPTHSASSLCFMPLSSLIFLIFSPILMFSPPFDKFIDLFSKI